MRDGEDEIIKDAAEEQKKRERARPEEELGEADDDVEAEADALGKKR